MTNKQLYKLHRNKWYELVATATPKGTYFNYLEVRKHGVK